MRLSPVRYFVKSPRVNRCHDADRAYSCWRRPSRGTTFALLHRRLRQRLVEAQRAARYLTTSTSRKLQEHHYVNWRRTAARRRRASHALGAGRRCVLPRPFARVDGDLALLHKRRRDPSSSRRSDLGHPRAACPSSTKVRSPWARRCCRVRHEGRMSQEGPSSSGIIMTDGFPTVGRQWRRRVPRTGTTLLRILGSHRRTTTTFGVPF